MGRTADYDESVGSIRLNSGLRKPVTIESDRPWGLAGERYIRITATPIAKQRGSPNESRKACARAHVPAGREVGEGRARMDQGRVRPAPCGCRAHCAVCADR